MQGILEVGFQLIMVEAVVRLLVPGLMEIMLPIKTEQLHLPVVETVEMADITHRVMVQTEAVQVEAAVVVEELLALKMEAMVLMARLLSPGLIVLLQLPPPELQVTQKFARGHLQY